MTDIAGRWAAKETANQIVFKRYKPFVDAVRTFVSEAQDGERVYFGIPEFDQQMRGIGKGQLCIINGYSHSGKTLFVSHLLKHNRDKKIVFANPDEPRALILAKLAALVHGVPADEMEDRVARGDAAAIDLLTTTATEWFPNLIVDDKPASSESMEQLWDEACEVFDGKPDLFIFDYAELLQAGETVPQKFDFLKGFGSRHEIPMLILHQTSRSAGAEGRRMTISSGAFGGEQHATFQIGVWRKKAAIIAELIELEDKIARSARGATEGTIARQAELRMDLEKHEYTLTAAITKNKRPGQREGRDEIDFELWGATGTLVPLGETDLPVQYREQLDKQAQERKKMVGERRGGIDNIPLDAAMDSIMAPAPEETWDNSGSF